VIATLEASVRPVTELGGVGGIAKTVTANKSKINVNSFFIAFS